MEGERGGLAGRVVGEVRRGDVGGLAGDGDDGAVVGGDHGGEQRLREVVVGEGVDGEGLADEVRRGGEERLAEADAGVVDEDGGGGREVGAHGGEGGVDGRGRGEVAGEVGGGGGEGVGGRLDVEDGDADGEGGEELDDLLADAVAAAGYDDELFVAPVVGVVGPVVGDGAVEPAAYSVGEAEVEEGLEVPHSAGVEGGGILAFCGIAGEKEEREREDGIEGCCLEETAERVNCDAWAAEKQMLAVNSTSPV